jgi:ribulose 1,5-bisphosphate synthetase/thiazole synthase
MVISVSLQMEGGAWLRRGISPICGTKNRARMSVSEYDLVVIGSGPAGQKGAIAAAKARKRVAIVDRTVMIGGVSVHTGTIPSKTVREDFSLPVWQ